MNWREELAWAAGLFDGEGNVRTHSRRQSRDQIRVTITQVDRRVLDRFAAATLGVGKVYGPYEQAEGHQPHHQFIAVDFHRCQAILGMIWAWLSPVKREQTRSALRRATLSARAALGYHRLRPTCKRGHSLEDAPIYFQKAQRYRSRKCNRCRAHTERERRGVRRMVSALLEA